MDIIVGIGMDIIVDTVEDIVEEPRLAMQ